MALTFQYGSNATRARLNSPKRLGGQARDLGRALTLEELDIAFDVFSRTNGCAASDLVRALGRQAWGFFTTFPMTLSGERGGTAGGRSLRLRASDMRNDRYESAMAMARAATQLRSWSENPPDKTTLRRAQRTFPGSFTVCATTASLRNTWIT